MDLHIGEPMNLFEFIVALSKALSWPCVAGLAIWLFRETVRRMLEQVVPTELDAWGLKTKFVRVLDKVEQLVPPSLEEDGGVPLAQPGFTTVWEAAPIGHEHRSPEWLVLNSWNRLEQSAKLIYKSIAPNAHPSNAQSSSVVVRAMIDLGMTADERYAMMALKNLRNKIAHSTDTSAITVEEALRFKSAADGLAARMQTLADSRVAAAGHR